MKHTLRTHAKTVGVIGATTGLTAGSFVTRQITKVAEKTTNVAGAVKESYVRKVEVTDMTTAVKKWHAGNSDVCEFCEDDQLCPYHSAKFIKDMDPEGFASNPMAKVAWESGQAWLWEKIKDDGPYVPEDLAWMLSIRNGKPVIVVGEEA